MQKSKSKSSARVASLGGLPKHPALGNQHALLAARQGVEEPARYPDHYVGATATAMLHYDVDLTADANGDVAFIDHYRIGNITPTLTAGVLPASFTVNNHAQYTSYTNAARLSRTLLQKVEVIYI